MKTKFYLILVAVLVISSCKKDWLEKKRDISIVVPTTLKDIDLLLSDEYSLNTDTRGITELSADDNYVTTTQFNALQNDLERNAYTWAKDYFWAGLDNEIVVEWKYAYEQVFYANIILETLAKIEKTAGNAVQHDTFKGTALFMRSRAFLNLAMSFCKYYDSTTAGSDLGIPLKLNSDIHEKLTRASLKATYDQILTDLTEATNLLQNSVSSTTVPSKYRPTKAAAFGLLARCYLYMDRYADALQAANASYALNSYLLDFNTLNPSVSQPIPTLSDEIHTVSMLSGYQATISNGASNIDDALYASYEPNDLRKAILFIKRPDGGIHFRVRWNAGGIYGMTAVNEMLLIRSEVKARQNDASGAMADLNTLLAKRYKSGTYLPKTAADGAAALEIVLRERRKELVRRGLRWHDLRRFNRNPATAVTLTRTINGVTYTLPPNDPRYVLPIPDNVIKLNGIQQNPR